MPKPSSSPPSQTPLRNPLIRLFFVFFVCSTAYIFGSFRSNINTLYKLTTKNQQNCLNPVTIFTNFSHQNTPPPLDFEAYNTLPPPHLNPPKKFKICPFNFTHYGPSQDPQRERLFKVERMLHRERHCPATAGEILRCLVPEPVGYKKPFPWPKNRAQAWFSNVPFKMLTESKKQQNWVLLVGDQLVFPGGGTSFQKGVKGYIDQLKKMVSLEYGVLEQFSIQGVG